MTNAPILVAYDGYPDAERALDWAATEARDTRTPVVVMLVEDVQPPRGGGVAVETATSTSRAAKALEHARAVLAEQGVSSVTLEHRVGRVVDGLLEAARTASVVVLGSQGHGGTGEMLLGSVSQHVARHATCPVVVVRRPHAPQARRIVVGIDGSSGSNAALAYACRRAERTGEVVTAIHGWRVHTPSTDVWSCVPRTLADEDDRRRLLAERVAGIAQDHPDVTLELEAVAVEPATCLVDASRSASLVVVGFRGRGFVSGMLLGSVGQAVLRRAACSVAIVR